MDQYITALYAVQSAFYTHRTNLRANTETSNVKMSSVLVMHDEVKACKQFISIVVCDYMLIIVHMCMITSLLHAWHLI